MMIRRLALCATAFAAACSLAACSTLGNLGQPDANVSNARSFVYTAVGASDAVGFGSSAPCNTAAVVIGADTEQMPSPASCPGGRGYVPDISGLLSTGVNTVTLTDLGISGAALGPAERALGNTFEPPVFGCSPCVPGDFITDELPLIPTAQNTITIFAGGNDIDAIFAHVVVACSGGCTQQQVNAVVGPDLANFGADYQTLLNSIHAANPFARIYLANLPNFGLTPRGVCFGANPASAPAFCSASDPPLNRPDLQFLLDGISTAMDGLVINAIAAAGVPVVDLECNAKSYDPSNYFVDGFHPDDKGYAALGQLYATAIRNYGAPAPSGNCGVFSQAIVGHRASNAIVVRGGRVRLKR